MSAPIYATHPVLKMGQMFMYDQFLTRHAMSDFEVFTLDDVDEAFAQITPLKYQQTFALSGEAKP
jgi:cleavage and polyadenylation specificity factor subunit 2